MEGDWWWFENVYPIEMYFKFNGRIWLLILISDNSVESFSYLVLLKRKNVFLFSYIAIVVEEKIFLQ